MKSEQEIICYKCEYSNSCRMANHLKNSGTVMVGCSKFKEEHKQTNADRIRTMTDEELAEFLTGCELDKETWLDWLEQEIYEHKNNDW